MHVSYVIKFRSGMRSNILGGCQSQTVVGVVVTGQICYLIIYDVVYNQLIL